MKTTSFFFAALLIVLTSGCTTPLATFKENSNGWKPADFKPENGVLLIQKVAWPKRQQRKIEDFMAKNYPHKYEFIDIKDLETNSKYADKNTYRFVMVNSMDRWTVNKYSGNGPSSSTITVFDFNFIDRLNDKTYPKSGIPSSWASMTFKKIMETYTENNAKP